MKGTGSARLQAIMDLIRKMHSGGSRVIQALTGRTQYLAVTDDFLDELSRAPEWVEEVKKSSCHKGAIHALTYVRHIILA